MKQRQGKDKITIWVIVITILITILIIVAAYFSGEKGQASPQNKKESQLEVLARGYDFGEISMAKGPVRNIFSFKNNTAQDVEIEKLYTSCMCTKATLFVDGKSFGPFSMPTHGSIPGVNKNLAPGQEATVEAIFDPAAHGPAGVGPIDRNVIVETSDGQLIFNIKAQVIP